MPRPQQPHVSCRAAHVFPEDDELNDGAIVHVPRSNASAPASYGHSSRNHVLVIDASQSMTEADWPPCRLAAALSACIQYITRLCRDAPDSLVAVVCFSDRARVICPWTSVRSLLNTEEVHDEWLKACYTFGLGDTAVGDALQEALYLVQARKGSAQVVLLTDGHHNTGVDPKEIAPRLRALATLAIVGIGGTPADVDEPLLRAIASAEGVGRPYYRWIGDEVTLVRHFDELAGRLARD